MTAKGLERLSDLLLKFFESVDETDGQLRDNISRVRFEVDEELDRR